MLPFDKPIEPSFLRLWPEPATEAILAARRAQNPPSCSSSSVSLISLGTSGLGSCLHKLSLNVRAAWNESSVAVVYNDVVGNGWLWTRDVPECQHGGRDRGFECLFEPVSRPCTRYARKHANASNVVRRPSRTGEGFDLAALRWVTRPNAWFRSWLAARYAEFWAAVQRREQVPISRGSLISVHIRWGDKLVESDLKPVSAYMQRVLRIVRERQRRNHTRRPALVFLSSEDGSAIEMFEEAARQQSEFRVIKVAYERPRLSCGGIDVKQLLGPQGTGAQRARGDTYSERWANVYGQGASCPSLLSHARNQSVPLVLMSMLNLYLALEAGDLVCSRASNWCRLLHELADEGAARVPV